MSGELLISDENHDDDDNDGRHRRGPQFATVRLAEKAKIAALVAMVGGGGSYTAVQVAQAQTAARVNSNAARIEQIQAETTTAINGSELRLATRIGALEQTVAAEAKTRQDDAARVQRSLGRIEGLLEGMTEARAKRTE